MSTKNTFGVVALVLLTACVGALSCGDDDAQDCDRAGCDAIAEPATGYAIATGIAGAAASQSDVVANGCAECTLAGGTLDAYEAAAAIDTQEAAQALIDQQGPMQTVDFDGTYEQELAPGEYLVCHSAEDEAPCAGITIGDGDVATIHIRYLNAPTELIVYEPGATEPTTDRVFEVSMP